MSFFSMSKYAKKAPTGSIPLCGGCGLYRSCCTPKIEYSGRGKKGILILSEVPSVAEDNGVAFWDTTAGRYIERILSKRGISARDDCWVGHTIRCHTHHKKIDDAKIAACFPYFLRFIKKHRPKVVIPMGYASTKMVIGQTWKSEKFPALDSWVGYNIPCQTLNMWIAPNYHPAFFDDRSEVKKVLFKRYFLASLDKCFDYPWGVLPIYERDIEIIARPSLAVKYINDMAKKKQPFAFDYEANCLKPEIKGSELFSCSICWGGRRTIAFSWNDEICEVMYNLFRNESKKMAANLKFEERWTVEKVGTKVRNWFWDTMIAAHIINSQPKVTGLKFQAYVLLGVKSYNDSVNHLLESSGTSKLNKIHQIPTGDLLLYNGMDSLVTFKVAEIQMLAFSKNKIQELYATD